MDQEECLKRIGGWLDAVLRTEGNDQFNELAESLTETISMLRPLVGKVNPPVGEIIDVSDEVAAEVERAQRKWHVKLTESTARSKNQTVLALLTSLNILSLEQIPAEQYESLFPMYSESLQHLVNKTDQESPVIVVRVAKLLLQLLKAKQHLPNTTAYLNSDFNTKTTKNIVKIVKSFRLWSSDLQSFDKSNTKDLIGILVDILRINPTTVKSSVGQIEIACVNVLRGTGCPSLRAKAAHLLASTPLCFGSNYRASWQSMISACFAACFEILEKVYDIKFTEEDKSQLALDNTYAGCTSICSDVSTTFTLANSYAGLCTCIKSALSISYGSNLFDIKMNPFMMLFQRGLQCAPQQNTQPGFTKIFTATLSVLSSLIPVAKLRILSSQRTLNRLLTVAAALPYAVGASTVETSLNRCMETLALTLRGAMSSDLCNHWMRRIISLLSFMSEAHAVYNINTNGQEKKSKRRRTQASSNQTVPVTLVQEEYAYCSALQCARSMLYSRGPLFSAKDRNDLDSIVMQLLQPLVKGTRDPNHCSPSLVLELLDTLLASVLTPVEYHSASGATPVALKLFAIAKGNANSAIVQFAFKASSSCQALVHPSAPVVGRPVTLVLADTAVTLSEESPIEVKSVDDVDVKNEHNTRKRKPSEDKPDEKLKRPRVDKIVVDKKVEEKKVEEKAIIPKRSTKRKASSDAVKVKPLKKKPVPKTTSDSDSDIPDIVDSDE